MHSCSVIDTKNCINKSSLILQRMICILNFKHMDSTIEFNGNVHRYKIKYTCKGLIFQGQNLRLQHLTVRKCQIQGCPCNRDFAPCAYNMVFDQMGEYCFFPREHLHYSEHRIYLCHVKIQCFANQWLWIQTFLRVRIMEEMLVSHVAINM